MTDNPAVLTVVGIGADGWAGLTGTAKAALTAADVIFGSDRQLALLPVPTSNEIHQDTLKKADKSSTGLSTENLDAEGASGEAAGVEVLGAGVAGAWVLGAEAAGVEGLGAEVAGVEGLGAEVAGVEGLGAEVAGVELAGVEVLGAGVAGERVPWPSPLLPALPGLLDAYRGRRVAVLASGDPMFHGIGATLRRYAENVHVLPHPSSVSLAAARLGWPLADTDVLSLVTAPVEELHPLIHPGRRILVLSRDASTPAKIAELLRSRGYADSTLTVLSQLGGPDEQQRTGSAAAVDGAAAPAYGAAAPAYGAAAPAYGAAAPAYGAAAAAYGAAAAAYGAAAAAYGAAAPAYGAAAAACGAVVPVDGVAAPVDGGVDGVAARVDGVADPADGVAAPGGGVVAPIDLTGLDPLNVVAIECGRGGERRSITPGLPDDAYDSDGQLTKREVRAVTLALLGPQPGELLWDVGAGSGSIAIEWLRSHRACRAVAVESSPERAVRVAANAAALGVPKLKVVVGRAPDALVGLPAPDVVFVGGGVTRAGVVEAVWAALPAGGRLVANAVTLESEAVLAAWYAQLGGEMTRLSVSRAAPVGGFTGWRAMMPVTIWSVVKP
ncbi:precorrin-6y C5,15-methyltransferase (decarboxylating) subunit CbiE [Actinoplanes sp. NPDC051859]|uniref:precorrin-6y C5,15-methyltransferase (decarboxylating) subunit CbiE n=1 Tax=Actinoplanes sp. NPDC051859 TaxID=3363909 RepID=UPI0037A4AC72